MQNYFQNVGRLGRFDSGLSEPSIFDISGSGQIPAQAPRLLFLQYSYSYSYSYTYLKIFIF